MRRGHCGIGIESLAVQLHRGARISEVAPDFTQQGKKSRETRALLETALQLLLGLFTQAQVEIEARQVEARPQKLRIEIERLLQFRFGLADHGSRPLREIRSEGQTSENQYPC